MNNRGFYPLFSSHKVNSVQGRFMDILDQKNTDELYLSILGELAKSSNELRCAKADLDKMSSRLSFLLVVVNTLIDRERIKR